MKKETLILAILLLIVGSGLLVFGITSQQPPVNNLPNRSDVVASTSNKPSGVKHPPLVERTVIVPANVLEVDSGIQVRKGEQITLTATGTVNAATSPQDGAFGWLGPDGQGPTSTLSKGRKGPLPQGESFMSLCYRIGVGSLPIDDELWSFAGSSQPFIVEKAGNLHFTVNDAIRNEAGQYLLSWRSDNQGEFRVRVTKGQ